MTHRIGCRSSLGRRVEVARTGRASESAQAVDREHDADGEKHTGEQQITALELPIGQRQPEQQQEEGDRETHEKGAACGGFSRR